MIKVVIADDAPLAREAIRSRLRRESDIDILATAASGLEAVDAIRSLEPDLVFLDVVMPGLDGFGVLEAIAPTPLPAVIFVTAHDHYAVRAFNAQAVHYLLKPIDDDRFRQSLERVRQYLAGALRPDVPRADDEAPEHDEPATAVSVRAFEPLTRLVVKDHDNDLLLTDIEAVDWIESDGDHAKVHIGGETFVVRTTIGDIEDRLDARQFARINRSAIVNIGRVYKLRPLLYGDFEVRLRDGSVLRMSRRYRRRLIP